MCSVNYKSLLGSPFLRHRSLYSPESLSSEVYGSIWCSQDVILSECGNSSGINRRGYRVSFAENHRLSIVNRGRGDQILKKKNMRTRNSNLNTLNSKEFDVSTLAVVSP